MYVFVDTACVANPISNEYVAYYVILEPLN